MTNINTKPSVGVQVGGNVDEATAKAASKAVCDILREAYETRASQESLRLALTVLRGFTTVQGTTIKDSTFTMGSNDARRK